MSSDNQNSQKTQPPKTDQTDVPPQISSIEEEKFMAILRQVDGANLNNMTEDQITEVIRQRGKIGEYIHVENMQEHERFKLTQRSSLIQLGVLLLFAIVVLGMVAFIDKAYFPQALTLIFGFVSGFGLGKTVREPLGRRE